MPDGASNLRSPLREKLASLRMALSLLTLAPSWVLFSPVNIEDPYWSAEVESKLKWWSPSFSVARHNLPAAALRGRV